MRKKNGDFPKVPDKSGKKKIRVPILSPLAAANAYDEYHTTRSMILHTALVTIRVSCAIRCNHRSNSSLEKLDVTREKKNVTHASPRHPASADVGLTFPFNKACLAAA